MKHAHNNIDFRDISFVVQGPIAGLPSDSYEKRHTLRCLESIRNVFPGSTIILSTWQKDNVEGLSYDMLVRSEDPGPSIMADGTPNCFRQIVSSLAGLSKVTTRYAVKVRPDILFKNDAFLSYFEKFNTYSFDQDYKVLARRVVVLPTVNPRRRIKFPFSIADWFFFGLTEDVKNIFDIPLVRASVRVTNWYGEQIDGHSLLSPEQYIWSTFLSKYKKIPLSFREDASQENIELAERYLANNCVMISAARAGIDWIRVSRAAYAQVPALSNTGLYTFTEYKNMLRKYAGVGIVVIPNPLEELVYATVYPLRFFFQSKTPALWNFIRRIVNPKAHRTVDELKKTNRLHS